MAAVLVAQNVFRREELRHTALLGELGLDGRVRPVRGVLPATIATQQRHQLRDRRHTEHLDPLHQVGLTGLTERNDDTGEAGLGGGQGVPEIEPIEVTGDPASSRAGRQLDLADVVGQVEAKWACEVAAAGRHHMLFSGPPGVGKTMLAERVPSLLPDLDLHDALEVSALHSLAGFHLADRLITRPPYSDPHHSRHCGQHGPRRSAPCQTGRHLGGPPERSTMYLAVARVLR